MVLSRGFIPTNTAPAEQNQTSWQQASDVATIEVRESRTIRTLEELLAAANVDQELWQVVTFTVNKWDSTVRAGDENAIVQLFQVKASLKRRNEVADLRRLQSSTIAAIADHAPTYGPIRGQDTILKFYSAKQKTPCQTVSATQFPVGTAQRHQVLSPEVVTRQTDVFPSQWRDVGQQLVWHGIAFLPHRVHDASQVGGVPDADGHHHEVEPAGPVAAL